MLVGRSVDREDVVAHPRELGARQARADAACAPVATQHVRVR
jgi:hypothetical protein